MDGNTQFFQQLYQDFNDRSIDAVIAHMAPDVQWANGMEGGFVHGHDGVRSYWTRQFGLVSAKVTPLEITTENGAVKVKVQQVVHDVEGKLLVDEIIFHFFYLQDGKIRKFEIGDKGQGEA